MASGDAAPLQTFVLRVSIHCHGCKKKVRKVLRGIEGVHDVKVDAQQHKVTVTGTVDAETLVRRLHKSGKQALPWQHAHAEPAKKGDAKAAPPETEAPAPAPQGGDGAAKNEAAAEKKPGEPVKEQPTESSEKKQEQEAAPEKKSEAEKETESGKKAEKEEAKEPSVEPKKDGGESEATESKAKGAEPAKEATAKEAGNDEGDAKKKKSKPKDAGQAPEPVSAAKDRSLSPAPAPVPRHAHEAYNPYYAPQPVMSYHMAQPRTSVSYYAPQPEPSYSMQQQPPQPAAYSMQQQQPAGYSQQHQQQMQQWSPSYLYMPYPHASPESYYHDYYSPPGTHASPPPLPMNDSYRLFDDENPNSCSVM